MSSIKEQPKVIALVFVAATVLVGGLAYTFWPTPMPPMPESADEIQSLIESKSYANLTREQKRPYVQRVSELMRTGERPSRRDMAGSDQARQNMRDIFMQMMADRARQFALADEATRQQMLQEDAARMQGMRGMRGPRDDSDRSDRPERTEEEKQARREQRESMVESWVNEGNGQDSALMREYMHQVRQQMGR